MACAQFDELVKWYPATTRTLIHSYLPDLANAVTDAHGKNPAGYVLYQIRRAMNHAVTLHGPERATLQLCDHLFSDEVRYHHSRNFVPRNVIPFFGVCWFNLSSERGERFRPPPVVLAAAAVAAPFRVVSVGAELELTLDEIKKRRAARA
jgi:hypothetical protein